MILVMTAQIFSDNLGVNDLETFLSPFYSEK